MGNREPNRRDLSGQRRHFQGIVDAIVCIVDAIVSSIIHIVMHCFDIVSSIFGYCCIAISIVALLLLHF